jgi:hypothetical protein
MGILRQLACRRRKSMQRRLAIFFAAALVALVSVLGVTACGGVQKKGQE